MVRLDKYILAQLMGPFGLFSLILIGVYWVNRALGFFDQLIGDGHSVQVFFELVILFLPQVVAIVLPLVSFIAAVYAANRLHSDSEFVVLLAAGLGPARLIRPFLYFSILVAVLAGTLSHYLVPLSRTSMSERQQELSRDLATKLLVAGEFLHPSSGTTFYIRDIRRGGELIDIFLHDTRASSQSVTYTAQKSVFLRDGGSAKLVMFDGMIQTVSQPSNLLSKVHFDDFTFDMTEFVNTGPKKRRSTREYSTFQALFPTQAMIDESGISKASFKYEAHDRLIQPLHVLVYPLIGMAALMLGGFSRFGVARQIVLAVSFIVFLNLLYEPIKTIVRADISFWPLLYLPDMLGAVFVAALLHISSRKGRRRHKKSDPYEGEAT